ncbi:MAG: hypothetical protein QNJ54_12385 [Prochloraceae cyanobacterium]|nr:hypothetical protein [Prochloraceae cyanobacterium]
MKINLQKIVDRVIIENYLGPTIVTSVILCTIIYSLEQSDKSYRKLNVETTNTTEASLKLGSVGLIEEVF